MAEILRLAAAIAVMSTLVSESVILAPIREKLGFRLLYCPICLGFWFGLPVIYTHGLVNYLATVGVSHLFMLITLRVYAELDAINQPR